MPRNRSRSRSVSRERDRKHKDKERDREKHRDRKEKDRKSSRKSKSRSRSRSPLPSRHREKKSRSPASKRERHRSVSPHDSYLTLGNVKPKLSSTNYAKEPVILDPLALEGKTEEEIEMLKVMGFSGFDTTKGKHVDDGKCNAHSVNIQQKRKYRQYMNRKGGFNRPLDPVA